MAGRAAIEMRMYPGKRNMSNVADRADRNGVYSVESLKSGIWYFCADKAIVISTADGFIWMTEDTAEMVANELGGILQDMKKFRSIGLKCAGGGNEEDV